MEDLRVILVWLIRTDIVEKETFTIAKKRTARKPL